MQFLKTTEDKITDQFYTIDKFQFHITNLNIDSKQKEYFEKFNGTISFYYNNRRSII